MALPYFFIDNIAAKNATQVLPEETSKHVVQVLRMAIGEKLRLADGKGKLATAVITDDHKKKCIVSIIEVEVFERPAIQNTIAISLLKNTTRFEWFLEKAAELGISRIVPLICSRTEKQHFRLERMKAILVSAMLQSQQSWVTELSEPVGYGLFLKEISVGETKDSLPDAGAFIAHCEPGEKFHLLASGLKAITHKTILIGPEGDFTAAEIEAALSSGCIPVTLGDTRLRTETAGVIAATLIQVG